MISRASENHKYVSPLIANLSLAVIGCLLILLYRLGLHSRDSADILWFLKIALVQSVLYLCVVWLIWRARATRSTLVLTLLFAAFFRLSILFAPPYLSDDIYRYIWDGRVQAVGINPYRYIPADDALKNLRDEKIYAKVNHRESAQTIYPPVAEVIFFLTTRISVSVTWMKTTMVLFEALGVWAIAQLLASFGLPRQRILIYAWHPLTVWEFAGSGHLDAMIIGFLALALLARRRSALIGSGVALASATLVKFFPGVLLPALYKRWDWKLPLVFVIAIVVAYLPYLNVGPRGALGFLFGYARERGMESGEQFFLLSAVRKLPLGFQVPTAAFVIFAALILGSLVVWAWRKEHKDEDFIANAMVMAVAFMLLLAPHFSWYFAWLIPFLCFIPSIPVFYLTLSSFLLYLTWIYWETDTQAFNIKALMFVPFFLLLAATLWRRYKRIPVPSAIARSA